MTLLTREQVLAELSYNVETGQFLRVTKSGKKLPGMDATMKSNGYRMLMVAHRCVHAHRVAWLIVHGDWPNSSIDHINGNPSDNRIANLRLATTRQNAQNKRAKRGSVSGLKGVSWEPGRKKWQAAIKANGKQRFIGRFATAEEAAEAYRRAALHNFGEFART